MSNTKAVRTPRVIWSKGDPELYQKLVNEQLSGYDFDILMYDGAVIVFGLCLIAAQLIAFPSTNPKKYSKKTVPPKLLREAMVMSNQTHKEWKNAGRPDSDSVSYINRKNARKYLKYIQRNLSHSKDEKLYNDIMSTHVDDNKLFHKLINRQVPAQNNKALRINGHITYDCDDQRERWAEYYEKLASPRDVNRLATPVDFLRKKFIDEAEGKQITVTTDLVRRAIKRLKHGKTSDSDGLQAEHFTYIHI